MGGLLRLHRALAASKKYTKLNMGRISCETHGDQNFTEMCKHVWEELENGLIPQTKQIPILGTRICLKCYSENSIAKLMKYSIENILTLETKYKKEIESELDIIYKGINRKARCNECLNTIKLTHAIKNKLELPFEPYQNTLMYKHRETVNGLKEYLLSQFKFKDSKIPLLNNQKALFISSGGVSYPLTINIYYVIEELEQQKILNLISDFYKLIDRKQRMVSFFEEENWIIEKDNNGTTEFRGIEKLLYEEIIK